MKSIFFLIIFLMLPFCQQAWSRNWFDRDSLSTIPISSLFSKATSYMNNSHTDTAMGLYMLIVKRLPETADDTERIIGIKSCNELGKIYFQKGYYTDAFKSFTTAMKIAEEINYQDILPLLYNNIGKVYCSWGDYTHGIEYFEKGMAYATLTQSSKDSKALLINIIGACVNNMQLDKAKKYYKQLCGMNDRDSITEYFCLQNNGLIMKEEGKGKAAIAELKKTAEYSKSKNMPASFLSSAYSYIGSIYESYDTDSALYYWLKSIEKAETPAYMQRESLKKISELYRKKNMTEEAACYSNRYLALSDSLFEENEMNRTKDAQIMYETGKIYDKIDLLNAENKEKERVVRIQFRILVSISAGLLCVATLLILLYLQKRRLNQAYKSLFERNSEILQNEAANAERRKSLGEKIHRLENILAETGSKQEKLQYDATCTKETTESNKKHSADKLTDRQKENIVSAIEKVMNTDSIYEIDFSIERLADLTGYNSRYISQIINESYNRNFRTFINEYRIREAQKRLLDVEKYGNYTIQAIAQSVGYKSHANFILLFKKHAGISPSLFQKMAKENNRHQD